MEMAALVASRSTCMRRQVGAVMTQNNRIISTGYNGAPKGTAHCHETGCIRQKLNIPSGQRHELCRGVHAEINAIIYANRYDLIEPVLYVTTFPCTYCAKAVINAGVRKLFYTGDYSDDLSKALMQESGIELTRM